MENKSLSTIKKRKTAGWYEEGKRHPCPDCEKSFGKQRYLLLHFSDSHMEKNSEEKPYSCPDCNKCFKEQFPMLRHYTKSCHFGW